MAKVYDHIEVSMAKEPNINRWLTNIFIDSRACFSCYMTKTKQKMISSLILNSKLNTLYVKYGEGGIYMHYLVFPLCIVNTFDCVRIGFF